MTLLWDCLTTARRGLRGVKRTAGAERFAATHPQLEVRLDELLDRPYRTEGDVLASDEPSVSSDTGTACAQLARMHGAGVAHAPRRPQWLGYAARLAKGRMEPGRAGLGGASTTARAGGVPAVPGLVPVDLVVAAQAPVRQDAHRAARRHTEEVMPAAHTLDQVEGQARRCVSPCPRRRLRAPRRVPAG